MASNKRDVYEGAKLCGMEKRGGGLFGRGAFEREGGSRRRERKEKFRNPSR